MRNPFLIALTLFLFFSCGQALAALSLSVSPSDGSSSLRFDRIGSVHGDRKEIRVRVSSTGGERYQVFQRIQDPVVNERGESLPFHALQSVTMNNSNTGGTLYLQNPDRLGQGDQLLYTSSQGGDSDSFVISYVVDPAALTSSGRFFGKILFTVRSLTGSSQEQAFVNIFIENEASWNSSVSGGRSPGQLRLKDSDVFDKSPDFSRIMFSGNAGGEVRIYQELSTWPQNAMAEEIFPGAFHFTVSAQETQNVRLPGTTPLTRSRTLIYSGRSAEDVLLVHFAADPQTIPQADAGTYYGKVKYIIENDKGTEEFLLDMECHVQPVFNLEVTLPPEGVSFANVLPTNPPMERAVTVSVRSNLRRPYQVLQDLSAPMANEKGHEIEKGFFTLQVGLLPGEKGQTKFTEFSPIKIGEYPIFSSDGKGSPATFNVIYRLQGYPQLNSGNYSAPIRFSLNEN